MIGTPDTMEDIGKSDLVKLSRELLEATVQSSKIKEMESMGEEDLKRARVVLGFLNAADKVMRTKIQYFKMANVDDKIAAFKERAQLK